MSDDDSSEYVLELTQEALKPSNIVEQKCFLCGGQPSAGSGEHIFPKWLQRRFDLWDQTLTLLNGSKIAYRNLRVPACENCNNKALGKTEKYVSRLSGGDVSDWELSHSYEVGRWMAKVFVALLMKESSLLLDRRNPDLGTIFPPDASDELFLLHLLVQSWRKRILFRAIHTQHPFTLYVYEIENDDRYGDFDFTTNLFGQSVCMRLGALGFVFVGDGGLQHHASDKGPFELCFEKLHPIQFAELAARVHYKATLRVATHFYLHSETPEILRFEQVRVVPFDHEKLKDGSRRVFRNWSWKELASAFSNYRVPGWEHLVDEAGEAVWTRLVDEDGKKITFTRD